MSADEGVNILGVAKHGGDNGNGMNSRFQKEPWLEAVLIEEEGFLILGKTQRQTCHKAKSSPFTRATDFSATDFSHQTS